MPTTTIAIHPKCSELVVTSGIPITTLVGRSSGNNISFLNFTYNDLTMRRKAQVLKYDKLAPVSQKKNILMQLQVVIIVKPNLQV